MPICTMDYEFNDCPFFVTDTADCKNENNCSFQLKEEKTREKTREERWYEKYYRKK